MDEHPLELSPDVFLAECERKTAYPTADVDEETEHEWAGEVRAALCEETDINEFENRPSEQVPVRYETE